MASIVNLLTRVLSGQSITTPVAVKSSTASSMGRNPFVNYNNTYSYAKNNPVRGGYFAGYYNGKQNIVGQRLFVEV